MLVCYRRPSAGLRMHNRCCASAYQLLCKRTTAVVRPTELTSPITYSIFSDNFICLFRQLLPYSAIVSYAHNRCCASAYQLLCKRTTAVVRPTELTSPITYSIFSDNFICLFRQLLPYSAIVSYALSFDIIRLRVFNNAIILIIR